MFENLAALKRQYEELQERLLRPEVYSDASLYSKYQKELKDISPVVEAYSAYVSAGEQMSAALELMDDPELGELAKDEYASAKAGREALEHDIQLLLLPKDPNDAKNVIFEIRSGVGGEESALFASDLYRMYSMYAEARGWKTEIVNLSETELGGIKEIDFIIEGEGAYSRLKYEAGGHRVQRVPVTESGGRIHTSAATVAVLPEIDEVDFKLDLSDVRIDVFRSSGAGGQKVNKTSSAVRLTHIPTGIVVASQVERSHFQNLENCKNMLRAKLAEIKEREHLEKISDIKGVQMKIEWGSQIRSYVFMPYQLVKDHRTEFEDGNIDNVMNGDLDGFINAYLAMKATDKE